MKPFVKSYLKKQQTQFVKDLKDLLKQQIKFIEVIKMKKLSSNDKLAIGLALGLIVGTVIENVGLGLVIGLIFGSIFKEKNKSDK